LIKNSQPFGKKCQKTAGEDFLTHTVGVFSGFEYYVLYSKFF